jgi:hypothetical protein
MKTFVQFSPTTDANRLLSENCGLISFVKFKTAVHITSPSNHRFWIPSPLEIIAYEFVFNSKQPQLRTFEFCSQLQQITSTAFSGSDLTGIMIPASAKILCEKCFQFCK